MARKIAARRSSSSGGAVRGSGVTDFGETPSLVGRRTVSRILNKRLAAIVRSPVKRSLKPKDKSH